VEHAREETQKLGEDESYHLAATRRGRNWNAATPLGVLHGLQTFLQLVEPTANGFVVPVFNINDQPRFGWPRVLIDVSRHFIPLTCFKRNLDGMAAVKMNVLHFHCPNDKASGSRASASQKLADGRIGGQYYTQSELREFLDTPHDRGIRVCPS